MKKIIVVSKIFMAVLVFVASAQPSLADTGAVIAHDTNRLPYVMRIERVVDVNGSTDTFRVFDCGEKYAGVKTDPSKCKVILQDIQGVQKTKLPERLAKQLEDFNNSKETNDKKFKLVAGGLVLGAGIGLCILTAGGCIWYPILEAGEGAVLGPLAFLIADVALMYGSYKWFQSVSEINIIENDYRKLSKTIENLSKTENSEAEITVSKVFRSTFMGMVNTQLRVAEGR